MDFTLDSPITRATFHIFPPASLPGTSAKIALSNHPVAPLNHIDKLLNPASVVRTAQRQTKLSRQPEPDVLDALERLVRSYLKEASLHLPGAVLVRAQLLYLMRARLQLDELWDTNPAWHAEPVVKPIFIIGLPRSGSTFLHETLTQASGLRAPLAWEAMYPCPLNGSWFSQWWRINQTRLRFALINTIAPNFKDIHPLAATAPQECVCITALAFASQQFTHAAYLPEYADWLEREGGAIAMKYHQRFLQVLQSTSTDTRWLLKAPSHSYHIEQLLATYPDATIVQTHRDPTQVIASISSLSVTLCRIFSSNVDAQKIGRDACEGWARAIGRINRFRSSNMEMASRFIDVKYPELADDPERVVNELLEKLSIGAQKVSSEMIHEIRSQHRQVHRHKYSLADFGLTEQNVRSLFPTS